MRCLNGYTFRRIKFDYKKSCKNSLAVFAVHMDCMTNTQEIRRN